MHPLIINNGTNGTVGFGLSRSASGEAQVFVSAKTGPGGPILYRENIEAIRDWANQFLEETKMRPPTRRGAIIRAVVRVAAPNWDTDQTKEESRDLVRADSDDEPWYVVDSERYFGTNDWFSDDQIVSFDVLFPGLED